MLHEELYQSGWATGPKGDKGVGETGHPDAASERFQFNTFDETL